MSDFPTFSKFRTVLASVAVLVLVVALGIVIAQRVQLDFSIGNLVIRSQKGTDHEFPVLGEDDLSAWAGWNLEAQEKPQDNEPDAGEPPVVKNLILMISDGMGLGMLSAASHLIHGPAGGLAIEAAPVIGLSRVTATNTLVPDSASAGTALATGFKTNKKVVGMLPDGRKVRNILEAARMQGFATGIVTTSYLVDATPSCFSAHAASRNQYEEIFQSMLNSGTDILVGGSSKVKPLPTGNRTEGSGAYNIVRNEAEFQNAQLPVLGLFPIRGSDVSAHGPDLDVTTRRALELLFASDRGFIVLIETEVTDSAGHDNEIAAVVDSVGEFDRSVVVALEFARTHEDTLVLVIADHDTGGPSITDGSYEDGRATIRWVTDGHTAEWTPLFAFGAGAEEFAGVHDATDVAITMARLMGLKNFPAILE